MSPMLVVFTTSAHYYTYTQRTLVDLLAYKGGCFLGPLATTAMARAVRRKDQFWGLGGD